MPGLLVERANEVGEPALGGEDGVSRRGQLGSGRRLLALERRALALEAVELRAGCAEPGLEGVELERRRRDPGFERPGLGPEAAHLSLRPGTVRGQRHGDHRNEHETRENGRETGRTSRLWVTRGVEREEVDSVAAGDIVWIAGFEDLRVGDTLGHPDLEATALPPLEIEEPTVSMLFLVNGGPLAGSEGKAVTLRQIRDRLEREARVNVALRVEDIGRPDGLKVSGRGELHLAILIEEMRREGIELCVSRPEVILREAPDGAVLEPIEDLVIDVPDESQGVVYEKLARRRAELTGVHNAGTGLVRLAFTIPTRGLIGYRSEFLTDTRGLGILTSRFRAFEPWRGEVEHRDRGAMVSLDAGIATSFALENLQQRGTLFVQPMDRIYPGMIIGESARPGDLPCNPTKRKHVTNHRSSTRDVDTGLKTPRELTLDAALEWIGGDELVEVTPRSVRVRKAILDAIERRRADRRQEALAAR